MTLLAATCMLAYTPASFAQDVAPEQKAEFRKLVRERDQLHRELLRLDRRATSAMKNGSQPVGLFAEQINVEDRLDLVQLRIEMMSTRYDLPLPALPGENNVKGVASETESFDQRIDQAFARGRTRARTALGRDCAQFLGSLDFTEFLGSHTK
jgi:hypothetical protein